MKKLRVHCTQCSHQRVLSQAVKGALHTTAPVCNARSMKLFFTPTSSRQCNALYPQPYLVLLDLYCINFSTFAFWLSTYRPCSKKCKPRARRYIRLLAIALGAGPHAVRLIVQYPSLDAIFAPTRDGDNVVGCECFCTAAIDAVHGWFCVC